MATSTLRVSLVAALLCLAAPPAYSVKGLTPVPVVHSIEIRKAEWMPLPADDIRRAVGDAALSRLTDAGRLHLVTGSDTPDAGSLSLDIALVAAVQTAKATLTLDVPGSPTIVSTASIALGEVRFSDIYASLEHVGESAAERLVAKLDRVRAPHPDDPARQRIYDAGQAAKRAGQYAEAAASFEAVVASASEPQDVLRQLAEDELRYGLPVFEAQQEFNTLGRLSGPGQDLSRRVALERAENLYRQIKAENPYDVQRVSEAQRALDSIIVMRGALSNAMRATVLSRISGLKFAVLERAMTEGTCPNSREMKALVSQMRTDVRLEKTRREGRNGKFYEFSDPGSGIRVGLRCDDYDVQVVDLSQDGAGAPPASR